MLTHPKFTAAHAYVALLDDVVKVGGHLWWGGYPAAVEVIQMFLLSRVQLHTLHFTLSECSTSSLAFLLLPLFQFFSPLFLLFHKTSNILITPSTILLALFCLQLDLHFFSSFDTSGSSLIFLLGEETDKKREKEKVELDICIYIIH